MAGYRIENRNIIYADHVVYLVGDFSEAFVTEYVQEMADELSPNGSIRDHARELRNMNNDGSWRLKKTLDT